MESIQARDSMNILGETMELETFARKGYVDSDFETDVARCAKA